MAVDSDFETLSTFLIGIIGHKDIVVDPHSTAHIRFRRSRDVFDEQTLK